jgi:S1-C subfamily serine protease
MRAKTSESGPRNFLRMQKISVAESLPLRRRAILKQMHTSSDSKIHLFLGSIIILLFLFSLYLLYNQANLSAQIKNNAESPLTHVIKKVSPSVVSISTDNNTGAGTGFIISRDGYIISNKHVVANLAVKYIVTLQTGEKLPAQVLLLDNENDLAILKIEGNNFSFSSLGNSDSLQLGENVIVIGNALGQFNNSVSTGVVSGLNRSLNAKNQQTGEVVTLTGLIQTDAAINLGNSGGPMVDNNGKVIGVNVATVVGMNDVSFSIPINKVNGLFDRINAEPLIPQSLHSLLQSLKKE